MTMSSFLIQMGVPPTPKAVKTFPDELRRPARVFLMMGYIRWWMVHKDSLRSAQEDLKQRREKKNFGILVHDDLHALYYQRLEYAIKRVEMSLHWWDPVTKKCSVVDNPPGVDGLTWEWNSLEDQRDEMRQTVDKLRERASCCRAWLARLEKPEDHPLYQPPEEPEYP